MIEKLNRYEPIPGDDLPVYSQVYDEVPDGFRFDNLIFQAEWTGLNALRDRLVAVADAYYADYEIVGRTYADFFRLLQNALDMNADTWEKTYSVYDDDISKPTQSRTIRRSYDITDADTGTIETTESVNHGATRTDKSYELPTDNTQTPYEVARDESSTGGSDSNTGSNTHENTNKRTGTETEDWSDVGVAPNYILLNGFIDNNRTKERLFVDIFKDCFTLTEALY